MLWIIIGGVIAVVLYRFFTALNKDSHDLQDQSVAEKFQVIASNINSFAFGGHGEVTFLNRKIFNLYQEGQNQIINFQYSTGHLTITWKYKYFQKELVHQQQFSDVRNLSIFEQQSIATALIREMSAKIESHKDLVTRGAIMSQLPNPNDGFNWMAGSSTNQANWLGILNEPDVPVTFKTVIREFLIPDNIDMETFQENERANAAVNEFRSLETFEMISNLSVNKSPIRCSPSFRNERVQDRLNRAPGLPDWLYIGYPDVVVWLQQNLKRFEAEFNEQEDQYITEAGPTDLFYRTIINKYKSERGELECSA